MQTVKTTNSQQSMTSLADDIIAMKSADHRLVVGIAGPPASGKSTLAEQLVQQLVQQGQKACLVPMDGFHLDNSILEAQGLLPVKGSPQSFDAHGFQVLMSRIHDSSAAVYYPTFNRGLDMAVAGSGVIQPGDEIIIVEGNYLLLDRSPWDLLKALFDHTIFIETPTDTLRERLVQRWMDNGYDKDGAAKRAEGNDIPNAILVNELRLEADRVIQQQ